MRSDQERLVLDNLAIVHSVVGKMLIDPRLVEDAHAAGYEGLVEAAVRFDPTRGYKFSSYAFPRVRGAVIDMLRRSDPVTRRVRQASRVYARFQQELWAELGRMPEPREVAERAGVTLAEYEEVMHLVNCRSISIYRISREDDDDDHWQYSLVDKSADTTDEVLDRLANVELLREAISKQQVVVNLRERRLLRLRYRNGRKFHEIGTLLGISETRVCQMHERILKRLREYMERRSA